MVARDMLLAQNSPARASTWRIFPPGTPSPWWRTRKPLGLPVTCEATPHHFALTDDGDAPYDSNYKMKPPLRCDVRPSTAVIDGLVGGAVDAIATDHAPHPGSEKMQEFEKCPFGIMGLETAIGLTLEKLVHTRRISLARMIALFTTGRTRRLRLGRGTLAPARRATLRSSAPTRTGRTTSISRTPRAGIRHSTAGDFEAVRWRLSSTVLLCGDGKLM